MKIAMIAPPWGPIPPDGYGGIERVVNYLVSGLKASGHDVILYTIKSSRTKATQKWIFDKPQEMGRIQATTAQLSFALKDAQRIGVDIIHDHTWGEGAVAASFTSLPVIHTVHSPLTEEMRRIYYPIRHDIGFAAISNYQRKRFPSLNWVGTTYNPHDVKDSIFHKKRGDYLLYLGRIARAKGTVTACEVAKRTGLKLIVAGAPNSYTETDYFEKEVKPYFDLPNIEYAGMVSGRKRLSLYASAKAFLFPIQWEEPFGMVLVEANASGTPIVAFRDGSVPELVEDGVNGYVVDNIDQMIEKLKIIDEIDPNACRDFVGEHFSVEKVTENYIKAYQEVIAQKAQSTVKSTTNFFEYLERTRTDS
jgi:glycosyltransferase involved in cell wall biosynthesis